MGTPAHIVLNNKMNSCLLTAGSYLCFCVDERVKRAEGGLKCNASLWHLTPTQTLLSLFPPSQSPSYCFASHILWAWEITDVSLKHLCDKYLLMPNADSV